MLLKAIRMCLIGLVPLMLLGCSQPSVKSAALAKPWAIRPEQSRTASMKEAQARIEYVAGRMADSREKPVPRAEFAQLFAEFSDHIRTQRLTERHRDLAIWILGNLRPYAPARGELLTLSEQHLKDAESQYGGPRESFEAPLRALIWHIDGHPVPREKQCIVSYLQSREPTAREMACQIVSLGLLPRFRDAVLARYAEEPAQQVLQAADSSFRFEYGTRLIQVLQDVGKSPNHAAAMGAKRMLRRLKGSSPGFQKQVHRRTPGCRKAEPLGWGAV